MPELNHYDFSGEAPTLYEVLQVTRDFGLVGEEDTVLTLVLSMVRGHLVVMTGLSRGGKDFTVDAAEEVFPASEMVHQWPADESATAAYYNAAEINQYPVHRFPDLARLPEHQERILKAFGEGRSADRIKTDIMAEKAGDDPVTDQVIECPQTVIAFLASDNENLDLNDYPEIRNRALVISVDSSEEQTRAVNRRKAQEHAGVVERYIDPIRKAEIQDYHASIPVQEWVDNPQNKILNPASMEIHKQQPIPELFPEARQDFDRLLEFMETVALYHYNDRLVYDDGNAKYMMVAPRDVWEAMTVLGNKMVMSALNLSKEDRAILDMMRESNSTLTKADIQQGLRSQGLNIGDRDVKRSLDSMRERAYVRVHQDQNPNEYSLNDFASVSEHDSALDYDAIVDAAADWVYDLVPTEYGDLYVERFCQGDGLITTHPFTGEAADITEDDDFEEMMESGIKGVEEVFEEARDEIPEGDGTERRTSETQARLT